MEQYPRKFIIFAIIYLLAGVALGLGIGQGLGDPMSTRFVHVHLNMLGFMAMFIYGVAHHILPRFNAQPLKHYSLMGVHFYMANIGLLGMLGFALADGLYGDGPAHTGFILSAMLEGASIALFAYNILPVLLKETPAGTMPAAQKAAKKEPESPIRGDMKVVEIMTKWPELTDVFAANGFKAITTDAAKKGFAKELTLEAACKVHKADIADITAKLTAGIGGSGDSSAATAAYEEGAKEAADFAAKSGAPIKRGEKATGNTLIGSLLEVYPETAPIFEKHYGSGCFSCPGQAFETISQTAGMHSIPVDQVLAEINDVIEKNL